MKKIIIHLLLALFLILQVSWAILYFNNYLPNFPSLIVRTYTLGTALGSIIIGLYSSKVGNKVGLSLSIAAFGVLMLMFWILGFLITRM